MGTLAATERRRRAGIAVLAPLAISMLAAASGCRLAGSALLGTEAHPDGLLAAAPHPKPPPRTIRIEVLFIRCAADDRVLVDDIWNHVDEQAIPDARRRALNANGLRAGVVTGGLPAEFAAEFNAADDAVSGDVAAVESGRSRQLLQVLPGRRSELVTARRLPTLVLLERCGDEVRGGTYHDATPLISLEARPAADGRVRIAAVPEVRHGPMEKSWTGEDGTFRMEASQRRHRMDHLGLDLELPAGGLLLVGCAGDPATTVGDGLLRGHGDGDAATVRLIAIRPLGRSVDPAFAATASGADEPAE